MAGFLNCFTSGGNNMLLKNNDISKNNNKKNNVIMLLLICFFIVFFLASCGFYSTNRHLPSNVRPTSVVFKDNKDNCYFNYGYRVLCVYNIHYKNYYQKASFFEDDSNYGFVRCASNSNYLFIELMTYNMNSLRKIVVYDKNLVLTDTIITDKPNINIGAMACNDEAFYWIETQQDTNIRTLFKYDITGKNTYVLKENVGTRGSFVDSNACLFFNKYDMSIYSNKTVLLCYYEDEKPVFFTDELSLTFAKKEIVFTNKGVRYSFSIDWLFNRFYSNAYLIDDKIVFCVYRDKNDKDCGYPEGYCICGWKESYLFSIDTISNELDLIREFPEGTIVIDYDLDNVEYYYEGAFYQNNVSFRKCERIAVGEKRPSSSIRWDDYNLNYYISYFDGEFYGIK